MTWILEPAEPVVRRHDAQQAAVHRDDVAAVWAAAFGPIDDLAGGRTGVWERLRLRSGYRLVTAHRGAELVGFGWGYTGERGQFWSDYVSDRLGPAVADWVGGHFESVELAVHPQARRLGVGAAVHDALLADLPHARALLGTSADPAAPAVRLYRSRGWQHLGHQSPGDQVMGLRLSRDRRGRAADYRPD